jgi:hypothetical protein
MESKSEISVGKHYAQGGQTKRKKKKEGKRERTIEDIRRKRKHE